MPKTLPKKDYGKSVLYLMRELDVNICGIRGCIGAIQTRLNEIQCQFEGLVGAVPPVASRKAKRLAALKAPFRK